MLDEYFQGTLPQLIERGKLLKGKIPRNLPRDYEALIRTCEIELKDIIGRLRALQNLPANRSPALHHARLRQFKRAVADLDHIETRAIAVLNRALDDDHHVNRLLYKICQEIGYPLITPTVTTLSGGYFYVDTKLNLMFIPPAEGSFLLHLPDLYHELGHPLLTHQDHPVLDRLRTRYLQCAAQIHDYFAEQRAKEDLRYGPRGFKDQIDAWEILWTKYWLTEFFCDLFAVLTLGPAFAWSHLHLYMKRGGDAFALPYPARSITHPADDARMRMVVKALRISGFQQDAMKINETWQEALRLTDESPPPDYSYCYPELLIDSILEKIADGIANMQCRMARPDTDDPIHLLLNQAWRTFWQSPGGYHVWEATAVKNLFNVCQE